MQRLLAQKRKKSGLSLRRAAVEIGVAFNTLARVERGHLPDLETLLRILGWLGISLEQISGPLATSARSTPDVISSHLNADPALSPAAAEKIAALVADLYSALAAKPEATAMHLRSAKVFLPAASEQLANMLADMEAALTAPTDGAAKRIQGRS